MNVRLFVAAVASLTCFAVSASAQTQAVTLQWDASPESAAAGYVVYVGQASGAYTEEYNVGDRTTFLYTKALPGRPYYFAVAAYSTDLQVGPRSEEVLFLSGAAVSAPSLLEQPDAIASPDSTRASHLSTSHAQTFCATGICYDADTLGSVAGTVESLTGTGDGRVIFIEDRTRVRVIDRDTLLPQPMLSAEGSSQFAGLVVDPEFARTGFIYLGVVETTSNGSRALSLVRYREVANVLGEGAVLIAALPLATVGDAAVAIDASGRFYVAMPATSDTGSGASRYDGKVLRFEHDGTAVRADGAAAPVFSQGYAKPTALASNTRGNALWLAGTGAEWSGPVALLHTGDTQSGLPASPIAADLSTGSPVVSLSVDRTSPVQTEDRESMTLIDEAGGVFRVVTTRGGLSTSPLIPPSAMGGLVVSALDDVLRDQIYLAVTSESDRAPATARIVRLRRR